MKSENNLGCFISLNFSFDSCLFNLQYILLKGSSLSGVSGALTLTDFYEVKLQ